MKLESGTQHFWSQVCLYLALSVFPFCFISSVRGYQERPKGHVETESRKQYTKPILKERDPRLYLPPESVFRMNMKKQTYLLVDVRSKKAFESIRIPGSIHIPLHALKTKAFLKSKQLVMVNEGYLLKPLEMEILHLRERGFQVWILHGGLSYWRVKGMLLEGDFFAQRDLNRVPPHAHHAEKDCHAWLKIDVSASHQDKDRALIRDAVNIPFEGRKEVFLKKWKAVMHQYFRKPLLSVLVFNRDGRGYEEIEKCIQATGEHNVFFLQGGLSEYGAFLNRQRHLLNPETKTTRPRPCPICPSN